jgi:hypothetical protein
MLRRGGERLAAAGEPREVNPIQHLLYFVTFILGAAAFYVLCRRWMGVFAATAAAVLMITQPVLWGHAFINHDTPARICPAGPTRIAWLMARRPPGKPPHCVAWSS